MKKILPIMFVLLLACNDDEPIPQEETQTRLSVRVRQGSSLENSDPATSIMWLFKKEGIEFQIPDPLELLSSDIAIDTEGNDRTAYIKKSRLVGVFSNELDAGTYFVVVMLERSARYSTTEVTLNEGESIVLDKIFPLNGTDGQHENW